MPPKTAAAPKRQSRKREPRYDAETGALTHQEMPPSHSFSNFGEKYLKHPKEDADHPLAYPCIHLITGALGCGKSSLIYSLLSELNEILDPEMVGRILYYTGSPADSILQYYQPATIEVDPVTGETIYSGVELYDPKNKESFCEAVKQILSDDTPSEERKANIIVVDDAVNDKDLIAHSTQSTSPLSKLFMSCRHLKTYVFLTSQKYNLFPMFCRANFSHLYAFKARSDSELSEISKAINFSRQSFLDAMGCLTSNSDFIWCNNRANTITKGLTTTLVH
jgi:hypothetical protein